VDGLAAQVLDRGRGTLRHRHLDAQGLEMFAQGLPLTRCILNYEHSPSHHRSFPHLVSPSRLRHPWRQRL